MNDFRLNASWKDNLGDHFKYFDSWNEFHEEISGRSLIRFRSFHAYTSQGEIILKYNKNCRIPEITYCSGVEVNHAKMMVNLGLAVFAEDADIYEGNREIVY